jgi:WD40 repeat protein
VRDQQVGVVWPAGRKDGLIISVNLDGDLSYLVEGKERPVRVVQGHNKNVMALGAGSDGKGKSLVTGSFEGKVIGWDLATGTGTAVDGQTHTNQVTQFAASSGRVYSVGWDDALRIVDESANTFAGSSIKLPAQPKGVSISDGRVIVALNSSVAVYVKDQLASELGTNYTPTSVAASGSWVAVGADENTVKVYKLGSSNKLSEAATLKNSTAQISALAFSKDGKHLAAGNSAGKIVAYKTDGWTVATDRWSSHTARVTSIAWSDDGAYAVSGALDTNVHVWSLAKPGSRTKAANAHKDGVNGVAWVEGGSKVASTGGDAAVKIWKVSGLP